MSKTRSGRKNGHDKPVVIFGGAGFIGSNVADQYLSEGRLVRVFDSVSRAGVARNLRWLKERHGSLLNVVVADIRDEVAVRGAVHDAGEVFQFAAQVAVTTSLEGPVHDFEVNARGTLNVLEALRAMDEPAPLLFTSTNKVYGGLPGLELVQNSRRYGPRDEEPGAPTASASNARSTSRARMAAPRAARTCTCSTMGAPSGSRQRYYVSDTRRFQEATGWAPQVGVEQGVARLHAWLEALAEERANHPPVRGGALEAFAG